MKIIELLLFCALFSLSFESRAKELTMEKAGGVFKIKVPATYTYYPTFLGLENVIMAPADKELGTSSLSLTITGIKDSKLDSKELASSQKDYQKGRRNYISQRKLELVEFIPYALKKNPQGHQIHTIGVVYSSGENITVEKSFMIECPQSFIHAKFLGDVGKKIDLANLKRTHFSSSIQTQLEKSVLGLTCQEKGKK